MAEYNSCGIFATPPLVSITINNKRYHATSAKEWFIGHKLADTSWVIYFRSRSGIRDVPRSNNNVTTATAVGSSFLLHAVFTWDGQLGKCGICDPPSGDAEV